jgi:hypothetical protein
MNSDPCPTPPSPPSPAVDRHFVLRDVFSGETEPTSPSTEESSPNENFAQNFRGRAESRVEEGIVDGILLQHYRHAKKDKTTRLHKEDEAAAAKYKRDFEYAPWYQRTFVVLIP